MSIKILLVDDHKIMREGLKSLIDKERDMVVVGQASNGREVLSLVKKHSPNIVVMDLLMKGLNGILTTKQIKDERAETKVIILTAHAEKRFVHDAFMAGVLGYLLKDCSFGQLAIAIRTVNEKQNYMCQKITNIMVQDYIDSDKGQITQTDMTISFREKEVLQLIAEGHKTKNIAKILHLSVKTIESHRAKIMRKLNINSVAGLTKFALREGYISN